MCHIGTITYSLFLVMWYFPPLRMGPLPEIHSSIVQTNAIFSRANLSSGVSGVCWTQNNWGWNLHWFLTQQVNFLFSLRSTPVLPPRACRKLKILSNFFYQTLLLWPHLFNGAFPLLYFSFSDSFLQFSTFPLCHLCLLPLYQISIKNNSRYGAWNVLFSVTHHLNK